MPKRNKTRKYKNKRNKKSKIKKSFKLNKSRVVEREKQDKRTLFSALE